MMFVFDATSLSLLYYNVMFKPHIEKIVVVQIRVKTWIKELEANFLLSKM